MQFIHRILGSPTNTQTTHEELDDSLSSSSSTSPNSQKNDRSMKRTIDQASSYLCSPSSSVLFKERKRTKLFTSGRLTFWGVIM